MPTPSISPAQLVASVKKTLRPKWFSERINAAPPLNETKRDEFIHVATPFHPKAVVLKPQDEAAQALKRDMELAELVRGAFNRDRDLSLIESGFGEHLKTAQQPKNVVVTQVTEIKD